MFEIHLTSSTDNIAQFKEHCNQIGLKPLLIELYGKYDTYQQVMTSSSYKHSKIDDELAEAISKLTNLGYKISRVKVEVNPNGYTGEKKIIYLESHLRVIVNKTNESLLDRICKENDFHKSKNAFKTIDNENYYMMAKLRDYQIDLDNFNSKINKFKAILTENNLIFDKIEIEGCVIDSNTDLDNKWLK